ncbi:MAG: fructosamine kinase family protein [Cyclobacteriaceae bacterium]
MGLTNHSLDAFFEQVLFRVFGLESIIKEYQFISGGCINNAVRLDTKNGDFFLKWNESTPEEMFEKEAMGLELLRQSNKIAVPEPIAFGTCQGKSYLLMEYLPTHRQCADYWTLFGRQLAGLHGMSSDTFGLEYSNYIGKLPQRNTECDDWVEFFIEHRLEVQLGLAMYNGHIDSAYAKRFRRLYDVLPGELPEEAPALLHGDLWSGNMMPGHEGLPTIFDPAVYYGSREMELAFTRLFGGFDQSFYTAYHEAFPLSQGFTDRVDLYNLYPLLVHVNLFGGSYLSGIDRTLRRYL